MTLTIADDVAAELKRVCGLRKARLTDVVNEALRTGLKRMPSAEPSRVPFQTDSVSLGRCLISGIDNVTEALAEAEAPCLPSPPVDTDS